MPRIKQNRLQYKARDYAAWLAGQMKVNNLYQADIARILGIRQQNVSYKFQRYAFTYEDKLRIFEALNTPKEEQIRIML